MVFNSTQKESNYRSTLYSGIGSQSEKNDRGIRMNVDCAHSFILCSSVASFSTMQASETSSTGCTPLSETLTVSLRGRAKHEGWCHPIVLHKCPMATCLFAAHQHESPVQLCLLNFVRSSGQRHVWNLIFLHLECQLSLGRGSICSFAGALSANMTCQPQWQTPMMRKSAKAPKKTQWDKTFKKRKQSHEQQSDSNAKKMSLDSLFQVNDGSMNLRIYNLEKGSATLELFANKSTWTMGASMIKNKNNVCFLLPQGLLTTFWVQA